MTLVRAYIWNHKVVLPNVVQTMDGFFSDEGPIEVFPISPTSGWKKALLKKLNRGNDIVPTPDGSEDPSSAILEKLNIVKWSTFEHQALMYTLHLGAKYKSIYRTGKGPDGMWLSSATEQRCFDPRIANYDLLEHFVQYIVKIDQIRSPGTGLSVIAKPAEGEAN